GELFGWLRRNKGIALVNRDDSHLSRISKGMKSVGYGMTAKSVDIKGTLAGFDERACPRVTIKPKGKKSLVIDLKVPGEHNAHNALAAAAVGVHFKVPGTKIQKALSLFGASSKRMEMVSLAGVNILNDTYNSNPDSVVAALSTLRSMNTSGKRIAVLADMLELGKEAMDQHRHIGLTVSRHNIEYLLTYGPLSKFTNDAAHTKFKIHYDQKNMLCEYLAELLSEGDVVLIKGSRE
ncbi:MAG: cyanophycin synthetase, partial [Bacteroidota bacterium]